MYDPCHKHTLYASFPKVTYVDRVLKKLKEINYGSLATVVGRYYAMDRDKRWERIKIAYEGLVQGKGEATTPDKLIEVRYIAVSQNLVDTF